MIIFFQAEDGIRDFHVTGVQTCALPILRVRAESALTVTEVYELGRYGRLALADAPLLIASQLAAGTADEPGNERVWHSIRSEERRVGKEWMSRQSARPETKKQESIHSEG